MRRTLAAVTAALALVALSAHGVRAAEDEGALMHAAVPQIEPVVLGEVTAVNGHSVTVQTTEGESMPFEDDSRTVMPLDLDAGTRVRIEFHVLDSGLHLAKRITPLTAGSKDWQLMDRRMTESSWRELQNENEEREAEAAEAGRTTAANANYNEPEHHDATVAQNQTEQHENSMTNDNDEHAKHEAAEAAEERAEHAKQTTDADRDRAEDKNKMAATASNLPLVLGGGLMLLALAGGLRLLRRRSA